MALNNKVLKLGEMIKSPFSCALAFSIINSYSKKEFKEIYNLDKLDVLRRYHSFKDNIITKIKELEDGDITIEYS